MTGLGTQWVSMKIKQIDKNRYEEVKMQEVARERQ